MHLLQSIMVTDSCLFTKCQTPFSIVNYSAIGLFESDSATMHRSWPQEKCAYRRCQMSNVSKEDNFWMLSRIASRENPVHHKYIKLSQGCRFHRFRGVVCWKAQADSWKWPSWVLVTSRARRIVAQQPNIAGVYISWMIDHYWLWPMTSQQLMTQIDRSTLTLT